MIGARVYARLDTPVHSVLHESAHFICMTPERRAGLTPMRAATMGKRTPCATCRSCWPDRLPNVGQDRICRDMDDWGYSFRLGSAAKWFAEDAEDTRRWLIGHGLIDGEGRITLCL